MAWIRRAGAVALVILTAGCAAQRRQPEPVAASPHAPPPLSSVAAPASPPAPAPLSLDAIFGAGGSGPPPGPDVRTLVVTGDVIPARTVNATAARRNDFAWEWPDIAPVLRAAGDLRLINLESPLVPGCAPTDTGLAFCGDPRAVRGLTEGGVDVAGLENNHIGNRGAEGITQTEQALDAAGIVWARRDHPAIVDVRGLRFGILPWNAVGERVDHQALTAAIASLRGRCDVVVVFFHWGREYTALPEPGPGLAPDDPRTLGRWAVDAGADLVVGDHPHTVQGVELYRGHLIVYAHGNLIFDQMFSWQTETGVIGRYTFVGTRLASVQFFPLQIADYGRPEPLSGHGARLVLDRMAWASRDLAATAAPADAVAAGGQAPAARGSAEATRSISPDQVVTNPIFAVRLPALPGRVVTGIRARGGPEGYDWVQVQYTGESGPVQLTEFPVGAAPAPTCGPSVTAGRGPACILGPGSLGRELIDGVIAEVSAPTQAEAAAVFADPWLR